MKTEWGQARIPVGHQ